MRRASSVIFAVILGALAVGIGTVPYLVLANKDRGTLSNQLENISQHAAAIENEKNRIAEEANAKVQAANNEVARAQSILTDLEQDQAAVGFAKRLSPVSPKLISNWETAISLPLGITVRYPTGSHVSADTATGLMISKTSFTSSSAMYAYASSDNDWLRILPYSKTTYESLSSLVASSTPTAYLIGTHLLRGSSGMLFDGTPVEVLIVRSAATSTHLVWIHTRSDMSIPGGTERILGTMQFSSKE